MLRPLPSLIIVLILLSGGVAASADTPAYAVTLDTPLNAPEGAHWMQVRAGAMPQAGADVPLVVIVMQLHDNVGTHMYHGLTTFRTGDLGATWTEPAAHATLDRVHHDGGLNEMPVDASLLYHPRTGKLIMTGATFWLDPKIKKDIPNGPSDTAYAVYDPETDAWTSWSKLKMPYGRLGGQ